jgi:hypothetical protein
MIKYTESDIAKYHVIGILGAYQANGVPLTIDMAKSYYEAAMKDITLENAIEKSAREYDKIMEGKNGK